MRHKIKLLLSVVLLSLTAPNTNGADATSSPDHRINAGKIKFGLRKPFQYITKMLGANKNPDETKKAFDDLFLEYKLVDAFGIQIGFSNLDRSKAILTPFQSLSWSAADYIIHYKTEPLIDSLAVKLYPGRYRRYCIYINYLKDNQASCYSSVFGVAYESDMGIMVEASLNKGLKDAQKMLRARESSQETLRSQIEGLSVQWRLGWNLAEVLL
ncbi:MAG: hypothetical protein AAF400_02625 [Bacteroidota bacterium]